MDKKGLTLIGLLAMIAIIGFLSALAVVALRNARCEAGDMEMCEKIGKEYIEEELECEEKKSKCRYNCADIDNVLDDCLKRCDIKHEHCMQIYD